MASQSTFSQSARPLARLEFGFNGTPQNALFFLSSVALTPTTFLNSFPSYPTLYSASQEENPENFLECAFIHGARPLARLGFGGASIFLGEFSLPFPTVPTPFTSSNSLPSYPALP